jgi:hypothetical protein
MTVQEAYTLPSQNPQPTSMEDNYDRNIAAVSYEMTRSGVGNKEPQPSSTVGVHECFFNEGGAGLKKFEG